MITRLPLFAVVFGLLYGSVVGAQYPMLDMIAKQVIQKYQQASCEELRKEKGQPPTEEEQRAIQALRSDPQMRTAFLNEVAGPLANKMFECGMIP
jgi:hypothetical protein